MVLVERMKKYKQECKIHYYREINYEINTFDSLTG